MRSEMLKRLDEALASYDKALAIRAGLCRCVDNRGQRAAGAEAARQRRWRATTRRWRSSPIRRGAQQSRRCAARLKRLDEALASYDKALAIEPNDDKALSNRGTRSTS